jgi:polyisoprenoid-binding protein YceI
MDLKAVRSTIAIAAAALLSLPATAAPSQWTIDAHHSSAQFAVKHLMISTVRGQFHGITGTILWDDKDITKSTVEATIDATTINTNEPKRDEHLKSADFFDVAKYPTITFKSTSVKQAGEGKLEVAGNLTMHGVTKPVTLAVEGPAKESKDPWGNIKTGATATTKLNRKDFGLGWNKALETGGVVVSDEVAITIELEMNKKVAAPAAAPKTAKDAK